MGYATRTKFVSRITIWIFVLLRRVSRAVRAADVATLLASLVTGNKQCRTLVASSAHPLTGLLMDQILSASLAGSGEDNLLLVKGVRVVGNNRGVLLVGLDDGGTSLAAGDNLGFGSLGRVTSTLGATGMLTVGALLGRGEGGIALVAGSANAHADGLIHTENGVVGRSSLKFRNLDIKSITLAQFLGALLNKLAPGQLGDALEAFVSSLGVGSLLLRGGGFTRLDRLRLAGGSGLAGGHGGQTLVGRTLSLEERLGSGEKLAETLLLLLLLGRRGPGLRRRAHDVDWSCVTGRLEMVEIDGILTRAE